MNGDAAILRKHWDTARAVLRETPPGDGRVAHSSLVTTETALRDPPAQARLAQLVASYKATGDFGDFIIATVLDAFLQLRADEKALDECANTVFEEPLEFINGFDSGWKDGVFDAILDECKSWIDIIIALIRLRNELQDMYFDYLDAVTDPSLILKLVITLAASDDRRFDEKVTQLLVEVSKDHSELAAVLYRMLDAIHQIAALKLLLEQHGDKLARELVSELGKALRDHWQADLDGYLDFRKDAEGLGFALGFDYGRLATEIALLVVA